jgi:capsular polysaccharide transport system permease protein
MKALVRRANLEPPRLREVEPSTADAPSVVAEMQEPTQRPVQGSARTGRKIPWVLLSFIALVAVPSLLAIIYFALIAAPQYASEGRLVVRAADLPSSEMTPPGSAGAAAPGGSVSPLGYSLDAQNAYIVAQYIRSSAIVEDLSKTMDLREYFQRPEADFYARLSANPSAEQMVDYWHDMVRSYVDSQSAIVTFEVRAFRPDDAKKLADAVIKLSEKLVNDISMGARQDIMRASEADLRNADSAMRTALQDLQTARNTEGMVDPLSAAADAGKLLLQLMTDRAQIEADLYAASRLLNKNAPSVRPLRVRLEAIDKQIATLKATITSDTEVLRPITSSLRKFEELEQNRLFAEKLVGFAEDSLDRARKRAERQNLYFMVFVPPTKPTEATYPERLANSFLFPIGFLIVWAIAALIAAAIEDHSV